MNKLFDTIESGANFSECRQYRYTLWRVWDTALPKVLFIGLNPSTANEDTNDPTIQSVIRIAKHNGYGGIYMMNCWAYIATDPKLLKHNPASNAWNDNMLTVIKRGCKDVVFAWGAFKIVKQLGRDKELEEMFQRALAIGITADGSPMHPLFKKGTSKLEPFQKLCHDRFVENFAP